MSSGGKAPAGIKGLFSARVTSPATLDVSRLAFMVRPVRLRGDTGVSPAQIRGALSPQASETLAAHDVLFEGGSWLPSAPRLPPLWPSWLISATSSPITDLPERAEVPNAVSVIRPHETLCLLREFTFHFAIHVRGVTRQRRRLGRGAPSPTDLEPWPGAGGWGLGREMLGVKGELCSWEACCSNWPVLCGVLMMTTSLSLLRPPMSPTSVTRIPSS